MAGLHELMVPGAPILVTSGSSNGAEMMVKEAFWRKGLEPRILDAEFLDPASVQSNWGSFNPGDCIIITEAKRADDITQQEIRAVMNDPDKIVVVADSEVPKSLPPEAFAHWAKF